MSQAERIPVSAAASILGKKPRTMTDDTACDKCNGTRRVALDSRTLRYRCPGPVPDDAKGVIEAACWYCVDRQKDRDHD